MVVTNAVLLLGFWEMEKVKWTLGFPGGSVVKNPSASAGDPVLIPTLGIYHVPQSS